MALTHAHGKKTKKVMRDRWFGKHHKHNILKPPAGFDFTNGVPISHLCDCENFVNLRLKLYFAPCSAPRHHQMSKVDRNTVIITPV